MEADLLANVFTFCMEVFNFSYNGFFNAFSGEGFTVKGKVKGWGIVRFIIRVMIFG